MNKVYSLDVPPAYPRGASQAHSSLENESVAAVHRVLRAVRRRLSLLVAVFLLTFAAVAVFTFQLTPRYTATASVIVATPKQKVVDISAVLQGLPADTATVDTEAEVLKSRSLIAKVVKRLDLIHNPEFNPAVAEPSPMQKRIKAIKGFIKSLVGIHKAEAKPVANAAAEKATLDGVINAVLGRISINRRGPTYVIEISATSENPQMAADLANTIADVYLNNQLDTKFQATRRAQEWLDSRVSELREEVSNAESKVEARRVQLGALAAGGTTLLEQAVRDLNAQLSVAQGDYSTERAKLDNLNTQLKEGKSIDAIPEALASASILELRKQAADIARKKADLQAKYFDTHPDVVRIKSEEEDVKRQIAAELQRLVSSLEQNVTIAKVRVDTLQRRLDSAKAELAQSNRGSVELNDLERDAEASRQLYKEFLDRFKQTNELEGITDADALINSEAPVPGSPSFPRTSLNLALGAMLGLALAAFVGLITELLDNYLSSPEEVERVAGAPYIGQVPLLPATGNFTKAKIKPAEYLLEKPHSGFAEAFRNLRASIMFADIDKAAKTVAVVSSMPDEGKTSMTYCLGRMAAMSGTKTIVIDGDIRRRQLTEISGAPAEVGLLEYLFGETRLADAITVDEKTGLHILPLTDRKHTPRDVFGSRAFDALLNMLQQTYDLIIIDTGPILLLAETRVVTRKVDQVVVCARWRKTNRGILRETMKILRDFNANVAGVVLTFVDQRKRAHYAYAAANYKAYAQYYKND
ncbi:MAG: polysaccharide biosynthesis tyrosine autokinase [Alphaproteobacteria bacterium]|nr:polysaccharide biosynthesis tyrosine autokinase [Alphaproteobacteria bacterium]